MRSRVVGTAVGLGLLALAGACASSTGSAASTSRFDVRPSTERASRRYSREESDSILAQALADREGPRVDVRATFTNISTARRMRAAFRVEDDAYVLIGHVDPDGNVRIVFPNDPRDDGFVKGGKSYETSEFFAGFTDQYRYRYQYARYQPFRPDSYDGAFGYVFIVASWRPMDFARFGSENGWDSFELNDPSYMNDPRPAIYELASLLAGDNRESYTVKFAKYYNTMNYSPYSNAFYGYNAFGYGMCPGFGSFGFAMSPFSRTYYNPAMLYGDDFFYRGTYYMYNAAMGCYYSAPRGYTQPYTIGQTVPGIPTRPRVLSAEDAHRHPGDPKPLGGKLTFQPKDAGSDVGAHLAQRASPQYRDRGLITADDPTPSLPGRRSPRIENNGDQPTRPNRPSIQQMVERRTQNQNDGSGWTRARIQQDEGRQPAPVVSRPVYTGGDDRPGRVNGGSQGASSSEPRQTYTRPSPADSPRSAPQSPPPRVEAPRSEPVQSRPASEPPSSGKPPVPPV